MIKKSQKSITLLQDFPSDNRQISMKKACLQRRRGFSLIEVLITLMVLSVGITAVSLLMSKNIKTSLDAKNQIIASELAQEGVELVRNLKDVKDVTAPIVKFTSDMPAGDNYAIDNGSSYASFKGLTVSATKKLYLNVASGLYAHAVTAKTTKFLRKISVVINPGSATVTSYVSWNNVDIPVVCTVASKCVSVKSVLPDVE